MNHKSTLLISIIVAVFNDAKILHQLPDSLTQQLYGNKELIVID
jgi:glycosyltransferase involved in cell wall biosynthesis